MTQEDVKEMKFDDVMHYKNNNKRAFIHFVNIITNFFLSIMNQIINGYTL